MKNNNTTQNINILHSKLSNDELAKFITMVLTKITLTMVNNGINNILQNYCTEEERNILNNFLTSTHFFLFSLIINSEYNNEIKTKYCNIWVTEETEKLMESFKLLKECEIEEKLKLLDILYRKLFAYGLNGEKQEMVTLAKNNNMIITDLLKLKHPTQNTIISTIDNLSQAEKFHPYACELIGPFLDSIAQNNTTVFYDGLMDCSMPFIDITDTEETYLPKSEEDYSEQILASLKAVEVMKQSLHSLYEISLIKQLLTTNEIIFCKKINKCDIMLILSPRV